MVCFCVFIFLQSTGLNRVGNAHLVELFAELRKFREGGVEVAFSADANALFEMGVLNQNLGTPKSDLKANATEVRPLRRSEGKLPRHRFRVSRRNQLADSHADDVLDFFVGPDEVNFILSWIFQNLQHGGKALDPILQNHFNVKNGARVLALRGGNAQQNAGSGRLQFQNQAFAGEPEDFVGKISDEIRVFVWKSLCHG